MKETGKKPCPGVTCSLAEGETPDRRNPDVQWGQGVVTGGERGGGGVRAEACVPGRLLTHGFLLPMPAERHAGCPCVTASMDDIYFEHTIR